MIDLLHTALRIPLIGSPMFIVSGPELVIAQCQAGIVGSFPALNARPKDQLAVWIETIREALARWDRDHPDRPSAPFAVNQIVHKSNERLDHDLGVCVDLKVPIVISSLGARADVNDAVHAYGGTVFHDVIDNRFARKAIEKGADGLIAVAAGAGGHAGGQSPFALVQEIREWFAGPLALSGSIGNGRSLLAARALGADFGYAGSLFIATHEAHADGGYKQMIVDSAADDIVLTDYFTGIPGNYLRATVERAGVSGEMLRSGAKRQLDMLDGGEKIKVWKDIWGSGQGIGGIKTVDSVEAVVERLHREYEAARRALGAPDFR